MSTKCKLHAVYRPCVLLPTPPPVEHSCEPGIFAYSKLLKIMTVTCKFSYFFLVVSCLYKAKLGKTARRFICSHDHLCHPTLEHKFCQVNWHEETNDLKAGQQINSTKSLNIYSCQLEIMFREKKLCPVTLVMKFFLAYQGNWSPNQERCDFLCFSSFVFIWRHRGLPTDRVVPGFEPWPGTMCWVLGQGTWLNSHSISLHLHCMLGEDPAGCRGGGGG